ncbi:hypothetical protein FTUN_5255 [Frigoriglobus tundricola]|uniref:Uncharacterized protein n=1 Tax=Frigoriglobus tundricola TaxID=2774151 RepID=A0A6M5YUC6_9BACT|nr:hypothetical protein FTUN_5255 [Frigoriglobus tundricola]
MRVRAPEAGGSGTCRSSGGPPALPHSPSQPVPHRFEVRHNRSNPLPFHILSG